MWKCLGYDLSWFGGWSVVVFEFGSIGSQISNINFLWECHLQKNMFFSIRTLGFQTWKFSKMNSTLWLFNRLRTGKSPCFMGTSSYITDLNGSFPIAILSNHRVAISCLWFHRYPNVQAKLFVRPVKVAMWTVTTEVSSFRWLCILWVFVMRNLSLLWGKAGETCLCDESIARLGSSMENASKTGEFRSHVSSNWLHFRDARRWFKEEVFIYKQMHDLQNNRQDFFCTYNSLHTFAILCLYTS